MKVYIYPEGERCFVALSEDGVRLAEHTVKEDVELLPHPVSAAIIVRDLVKIAHPGEHKMLWVADPDSHPILRGLLQQREIEEPLLDETPSATHHLCPGCVHSSICGVNIAAEAARMTLTISMCGHYVEPPPPGEESHE